jgi:sugar/nucleoside kinase (ribokinase family)
VSTQPEAIVAGHICLDLIPLVFENKNSAQLLTPGTLTEVGPAVISTGGAVSNTGLALHRLGITTGLAAKIGDDLFGRAVLDIIRSHNPSLSQGMIVTPGETTSYSVVISPPNTDRLFLHCPGANNTFVAADLPSTALAGSRLLHFGYPPLMRKMWEREGQELTDLLSAARGAGVSTSLDMVRPDPASEAGQAAWPILLANVLPAVDIFLPSLEEILFMLERQRYQELDSLAGPFFSHVDTELLAETACRLISMGVAMVVLKLGDSGIYLRTSGDESRWRTFGLAAPTELGKWKDRELLAPCFKVDVVGTTGAGDCTIAGFLAALLRDMSPEQAVTRAVAVGAANVEKADATSGIPTWAAVENRIQSPWPRLDPALSIGGDWRWQPDPGLWVGPDDRTQLNTRERE